LGWGFSDLAHFAPGFKQVNTVHDVASGKATLDAIPRDELVIVPRSKRTNSNRRRDFPL